MYQGVEYTGFIFDTSSKIVLYSHALLEKPAQSREFSRLPLLGYFKVSYILGSVNSNCAMALVEKYYDSSGKVGDMLAK